MKITRNHHFFILVVLLWIGGCGGANQSSTPDDSRLQTLTTPGGVTMVLIPAGEFIMGTDQGEEDEKPAHLIKVSAFYMDRYEVTQKDYEAVMGRNPSKFKGPDHPVEQLGWNAAVKYCNTRSLRDGFKPCYQLEPLQCDFTADGYRLPTEAEWEYACRAGADTDYSFGDNPAALSQSAWYKVNANQTTHPVGQKLPNARGLYDMHGNVWEWCNDFYSESYYSASPDTDPRGPETGDACVLRGGGWNSTQEYCRASARLGEAPGLADVCFGYDAYGFRCVRKAGNEPSPPSP
ncbi:MAG: formylglycine-generating enzyme family protein [bacterium]